MRTVFILGFIALFFLITPPAFYLLNSETVTVQPTEKVAYRLPYPGLLPDHPLFFLKSIRDKLLELGTRDLSKKAELFLLQSDKKVAMANALAQKGKDKQAIELMISAEHYFLKIPKLLDLSKKQGSSPSADLVGRLKLSNAKHKEEAEIFSKEMPAGQQDMLEEVMRLNREVEKAISPL